LTIKTILDMAYYCG